MRRTRVLGFRVIKLVLGLMLVYGGLEDVVEIWIDGADATPGRFGMFVSTPEELEKILLGRPWLNHSVLALDALVSVVLACVGMAMLYRSHIRPGVAAGTLLIAVAVTDETIGLPNLATDMYFGFYWGLFSAAFVMFARSFPTHLTTENLRRLQAVIPIRRLDIALLDVRLIWLIGLVLGGLWWGFVYRNSEGSGGIVPSIALVCVALFFFLLWQGVKFLRAGSILASEDLRHRTEWFVQGCVTYVLGLVALHLGFIVAAVVAPDSLEVVGIGLSVLYEILCAATVVFLAIAVFRHGAFDPRHVLRKTTFFGILGIALLATFVVAGAVTSLVLVGPFGLPEESRGWVAAVSVAVLMGPFRRTIDRRVDRILDWLLPPTELVEERRYPAVVAFSDIVGYTDLSARDEKAALTMAALFHRTGRRVSEEYGGRVVKTIGDAVLLEFLELGSALTAVRQLVDDFMAEARRMQLPGGALRTGVHFGPVSAGRDGDIFGDTVNIAARLQGRADPGQIVLSAAVKVAVDSAITVRYLGPVDLKNVPEPVECYSLV